MAESYAHAFFDRAFNFNGDAYHSDASSGSLSERPWLQGESVSVAGFFRFYFDKTVTSAVVSVQPVSAEPARLEQSTQLDQPVSEAGEVLTSPAEPSAADALTSKPAVFSGVFERLKQGLGKTRQQIGANLLAIWTRDGDFEEVLEDIESQLLMSDVGMEATDKIIEHLRGLPKSAKGNADALKSALSEVMQRLLVPVNASDDGRSVENPLSQANLEVQNPANHPFMVLMVGVNGVGKTTTIAKLTARFLAAKKTVLLAAGDTFRAAAVEQLKTWADRHQVPVVAQQQGADSASVIFDAFSKAKAKGVDLVLADTAGRLHNKGHLMAELEKIGRVLRKQDAMAPHMVLLVLDASTGQNAINQAQAFHEAMPLSGIVLTKMDGTAKGGIAFALVEKLGLPIWYIGVGEQAEDLREFDAAMFVDALLSNDVHEDPK